MTQARSLEAQRATERARGNVHPTVKSIALMMHLVKLSGAKRIGDLCVGSGATAIACALLGAEFVGAELCPEAVAIAEARLAFWRGISPAMLDAFISTGELPTTNQGNGRQISLF